MAGHLRASECLSHRSDAQGLPALRRLIPTYGIDLKVDADACRKTRAETARSLKLENV